MPKIRPAHALYNSFGNLVIIDTKGRVWVYNNKVSPTQWVMQTELPQAPPPE